MPENELYERVKYTVKKFCHGDEDVLKEAYYCVSRNLKRAEAEDNLKKLVGRSKVADFVDRLYDETYKYRKRKERADDGGNDKKIPENNQENSKSNQERDSKYLSKYDEKDKNLHMRDENGGQKSQKDNIDTKITDKYLKYKREDRYNDQYAKEIKVVREKAIEKDSAHNDDKLFKKPLQKSFGQDISENNPEIKNWRQNETIVKNKETDDGNKDNKYVLQSDDHSRKVHLLHQKIQQSLAKHGLLHEVSAKQGMVDPNDQKREVYMNEFGQTIDAKTGQPITLVQHTPTAKINLRAKRKIIARNARAELKLTEKPKLPDKNLKESAEKLEIPDIKPDFKGHFDPRIKETSNVTRKTRQLEFIEPGKISKHAQTERTKIQFEKLQNKIQDIARRTGIASATKLAMVTLKEDAQFFSKTPEIEWWDTAILGGKNYESFNEVTKQFKVEDIKTDPQLRDFLLNFFIGITNLVEHPVPRLPPGEAKRDSAIKIFLTKNEQRKIRTRRRIENEKEKQEKILLGLMPPPPPKVKMSNLMRVLGTEAVQDPTKVEAYVKSQIAARQTAHELANAARKLTPEQKTAKLLRKYTEDTSLAVHVAVYRIWDLTGRAKRFKIEKNAQQNHMTGCMIMHHDMNLVILEGGPNSQKRMKRLLLHRIHWSEDKITVKNQKAGDCEMAENKCVLIWEGVNGYHNFKNWKFKSLETESLALEFLRKHQSDQFWNLAYSFTVDS